MTLWHPSEWEWMQLRHPCAYCDVPAGEWCVTASGHPAQFMHSPRFHLALDERNRKGNQ